MRPGVAIALGAALVACRGGGPATADAGGSASSSGRALSGDAFEMADLVAATALDAQLARLSLFATEYKLALTLEREPRLREHTDQLARQLDEAAAGAERALGAVKDPRDRALAAPLVAAARRWPALLQEARAELLGPPNVEPRASRALAAADDEVVRALESYRRFRSGWRIVDAPQEPQAVVAFLEARRALEFEESRLGAALPEGPGRADAGIKDLEATGKALERLLAASRDAAGRVEAPRGASAGAWVEAQGRALRAMLALGAPGVPPEERARRSLEYQVAKVRALDAVAEYTRLTAQRPAAAAAPAAAH